MSEHQESPFNAEDLHQLVQRTLRKLEAGELGPSVANSLFNGVQKTMTIVRYQMEYAKLRGKFSRIPLMEPTGAEEAARDGDSFSDPPQE